MSYSTAEAASAVVGDVIDCARHENKQKFFGWADSEEGYVSDYLDMPTALYVRARAQQKQQVISSAEKTFGEIKLLKRAGPRRLGARAAHKARNSSRRRNHLDDKSYRLLIVFQEGLPFGSPF